VASSSNTSITWPTTAPDGAATGTITIRYAPQTSWVKVYAGTNKAVYRSTDPQSHGQYLRVDDTGGMVARVRGFEDMTDVDSGTGPFPTDAQMSGGGYWHKSTVASNAAAKYWMFADSRFLHVCIAAGAAQTSSDRPAPPRGFGDMLPLAPGGDVWATLLNAGGVSNTNFGFNTPAYGVPSAPNAVAAFPRAFSGLGSASLGLFVPYTGWPNTASGQDTLLGALPSSVDGQVKTSAVFVRADDGSAPPRALVPGFLHIPQTGAYGPLQTGDKLEGSGPLSGRRLLVLPNIGNGSAAATPQGVYLIDITGPWR
jgi:hypothetical protein